MNRKKLYFIGCCLVLLAVSCQRDPSYTGEVAACPQLFWNPPLKERCESLSPREECDPVWISHELGDEEFNVGSLIDLGLSNHPMTREAWANARAAAFSYRVARSELYPTVELQEVFSYINERNGNFGSEFGGSSIDMPSDDSAQFRTLESELTLSYLLFDFGGREASIEAAKQVLYATNWTHNYVIQSVVFNILQSYYNYLYAKADVVAKESDLEDAEKNLEAAQAKYRSGVVVYVDVLQAKTSLVQAKLLLEQSVGQAHIAEGELASAVGLSADTPLKVGKLPETFSYGCVVDSVDQLMAQALHKRPDLISAEANYSQKKALLNERKAERLPNLSFQGIAEKNNHFSHPSLNGHFFQASISLQVPIFSGFLYQNQIRNAKAEVEAARQEVKNTALDVSVDVVTSNTNFLTAVESVKFSRELVESSSATYEMIFSGYKEGTQTILDLLSAQRDLADARAQWVQARTQWLVSLAQVAFATGQLSPCDPLCRTTN